MNLESLSNEASLNIKGRILLHFRQYLENEAPGLYQQISTDLNIGTIGFLTTIIPFST
jgi:hypothetical protein